MSNMKSWYSPAWFVSSYKKKTWRRRGFNYRSWKKTSVLIGNGISLQIIPVPWLRIPQSPWFFANSATRHQMNTARRTEGACRWVGEAQGQVMTRWSSDGIIVSEIPFLFLGQLLLRHASAPRVNFRLATQSSPLINPRNTHHAAAWCAD